MSKHQSSGKPGRPVEAAIYARISTPTQSLDGQVAACRDYAKQLGARVVLELRETSSGRGTLPVAQQLLEAARRDAAPPVLIVQALDRLGRDAIRAIARVGELDRLGVTIHAVTGIHGEGGPIDPTTFDGRQRLVETLRWADAEAEQLAERRRAGQARARAKGKRWGNEGLSAATTRHALELWRSGKSVRSVARETGVSKSAVQRAVEAARTGRRRCSDPSWGGESGGACVPVRATGVCIFCGEK